MFTKRKIGQLVSTKTRLDIETLESRQLMAVGALAGLAPRLPPDLAGGTPATAQIVNLAVMEQAHLSDYLPSASDVDVYRVSLRKGDYLVADVDSTGSVPLNGTVAILDDQARQLAFSQYASEPENNAFRAEPAIGFYAPTDGVYYVQAKTTDSTLSANRSYQLNLERIGLEDLNRDASDLAEEGRFRAWLNDNNKSLHIAGPSGYGFVLEGDWNEIVGDQKVTYRVNGPVMLRTSYLEGSVGGLPLYSGSDGFSVEVAATGWHELGELKGTSGGLGFSLGLLTEDLDRVLGIHLDEVAVGAKWKIVTGEQVRENYPQHEISQVLDGVPYLVYGETGRLAGEFGNVRITTGDAQGLILIADPADPFLYVGYDDVAVAGSLEGRIPFNATVGPQAAAKGDGTLGLNLAQATDAYFGHLYLSGEVPLAGFKVPVIGDLAFTGAAGLTLNLDANGDGEFLGGAGTAEELQRGNLSSLEIAVRDINFAVNGQVNVGFDFAGYTVEIPLGTASVYYSGPQQKIFFDGIQGMGADVWRDTPLKDFRSDTEIRVNGFADRDGRFSVTSSSRYYLLNNYADLGITVRSEGTVASTEIVAAGTLHTWIGQAQVTGTIGLTGDFVFTGSVALDIGNSSNFTRGLGVCTVRKSGASVAFTVEGDFDAQVKIDNVAKAAGRATGKLTMTIDASGTVAYSTNLFFSGKLSVWNPTKNNFRGGWSEVGSASGGFSISSSKLRISLGGHQFSVSLP